LLYATVHSALVEADLIKGEGVGVFSLDTPRCQCPWREISYVVGDYDLCMAFDGCGEYVPIIGIGELQCVDERFL
jgi:hypothetical protein